MPTDVSSVAGLLVVALLVLREFRSGARLADKALRETLQATIEAQAKQIAFLEASLSRARAYGRERGGVVRRVKVSNRRKDTDNGNLRHDLSEG